MRKTESHRARRRRVVMKRRWHKHQVGRYQLSWYWGTRGAYGYGWKANRNRICAGKLYVTMWREVRPNRFSRGWWD